MKKFIIRLSTFLILLTATYCSAISAIIYLNKRALDNCSLGGEYSTVIIGDSHTMWAFDDALLEGVRNISLNAEGYKYSYSKLKNVLEKESGIKNVYIGFSYHNLSGYYDDYIVGSQFLSFIDRYLPILVVEDYLDIIKNRPENTLSMVSQIGKRGWKFGLTGQCNLYGAFPKEPMTRTFDTEIMKGRIREQFYYGQKLREKSDLNLEYLTRLVELSRDYGVDPVMLNTPLHPEYLQGIPEYYLDLYDNFLEIHHLRYFSFGELVLADEYFLPDGDHVNHNGALITTQRFKEYVSDR